MQIRQPDEPVWLDADLTRLAQVFSNLLNNSAKYMEPGGTIVVEASADAEDVVVAVRDTGIGIAPEVLPHVFDMFVQADRSLERAHGGLGIGLTLVRRLVELHDGTVTASQRRAGQGQRVRRAAAPGRRRRRRRDPPPPPPRTRGRRCPSDAFSSSTTTRTPSSRWRCCCRSSGSRSPRARDGLDALAQVEQFGPEVVVLDIGLPGLNGYEVARADPRDGPPLAAACWSR